MGKLTDARLKDICGTTTYIYFIGINTLRANWVVVSCVYLHVFHSLEAKLKRQVQNKKRPEWPKPAKALGVNLAVNVSVSSSHEIASVAKSNEYPIAFRPKGKNHHFVTKKYNCFLRNILQGS